MITKEKQNGVVYTPEWVANLILNKVGYEDNIYDKTIIDSSCGDGRFLGVVLKRFMEDCYKHDLNNLEIKGYIEKGVFGFDVDEKAVEKCKQNLNEITLKYNITNVKWNIFNVDGLDKNFIHKYYKYFDFVIGNPPYVRIQHLGKERRKKIQLDWSFCKSGSTDIYIAFFEMGINLLKDGGLLGYITPNTFFKTETAKYLRTFLSEQKLIKEIINFNHHQIFNNATTYSAITILEKGQKKDTFDYYIGNANQEIQFVDKIETLNLSSKQWVITSNVISKRIKEIETRGVPLGEMAKIHVGVTTLADDFYIFKDPIIKDDKAIITLKDKRTFTIEKSILKPIVKASVLKNSNEEQHRFIIFPYKKVNGKHIIIPEEELKENYPLTYSYFLNIKERLFLRDKGKPNAVSWFAFGRSQGLDTSFGRKILTSAMNLTPRFIVWGKEEYTFYAGYCIKFNGDLDWLSNQLNSEEMDFYDSLRRKPTSFSRWMNAIKFYFFFDKILNKELNL